MAHCELMPGCLFFNDVMDSMPATAEAMKHRFCLGDNEECARYIVFRALGKEGVPRDLFPSNVPRARRIIRGD